mgnify:CR=1 FL=1
MKKVLLPALFILSTLVGYSQIQEYSAVIPMEENPDYYVVSRTMDSTFITYSWKGITVNNLTYSVQKGKGKKKDFRGIRERQKRYLITPEKDTAYFIEKNVPEIYVNDSLTIEKVATDFGWQFVNHKNEVICEVDLLWNNVQWNYYMRYYRGGVEAKAVKEYLSMNMVPMAKGRSNFQTATDEAGDFFLDMLMWFVIFSD